MYKIFRNIAATLLIAVMLFCGYQMYLHYSSEMEIEKQFDELVEQIVPPPETDEPEVAWTVYDQYKALFDQNSDMIGWIAIDGTIINFPVMHTPDRPNFYLKHNFEKAYSDHGTPYVDGLCSLDPQSDNLLIYGHHMRGKKMFGALESYKNAAFYREHPIIRFDTLAGGFGEYEIFAVFKIYPANFNYHHFIDAADEEAFDEYVRRCKSLSFYDTGVTAEYGDKLITLSTCEYSREGNRLVVVAKQMQSKNYYIEEN